MGDRAHTPADLAFVGGGVYTVDPAARWAGAVAVRDGVIVRVGSHEDVDELIGPRTRTVDLRGRMLLPGFQDAHVHAAGAGLDRLTVDLSGLSTVDAYRERILAYGRSHPDEPWIRGGGWSMELFPGGVPDRATLDAVVPDRPVFLSNRDNHAAWVNGSALSAAGIDRRTPDPQDGRIERDARGEAQGTLHEGAMDLVRRRMPDPPPGLLLEALEEAQAYLHSLGITGWQEAIVGPYPTIPDVTEAYPAFEAAGRLTARVVGALWWRRDRGLEQIGDLVQIRRKTAGARYRPTTIKIMLDGVVENRTAAMTEPYQHPDGSDGGIGLAHVERAMLLEAVTALDAEGFDVHIHAIGDRAVRDALDAIARARGTNGYRGRHHLAHLQVVDPRDVPRFAGLAVTANLQMLWAVADPTMRTLVEPVLGPVRSRWQYPFASLAAAGATLAAGSDWPVSTPDVLEQIRVGITRIAAASERGEPFLPHERLSLPHAIRAFTAGSAFVNRLDHVTGSIAVGKAADLVVLSANLFEPGGAERARPLLTLVDGVPVFEGDDV